MTHFITSFSRVTSSLLRTTVHVILSAFIFLCLVSGFLVCFILSPVTRSVWVVLESLWGGLGEFCGSFVCGGGSPPYSPSFFAGGSSYRKSYSTDNRSLMTGNCHSFDQSWVITSTYSLENKNWVANHWHCGFFVVATRCDGAQL